MMARNTASAAAVLLADVSPDILRRVRDESCFQVLIDVRVVQPRDVFVGDVSLHDWTKIHRRTLNQPRHAMRISSPACRMYDRALITL